MSTNILRMDTNKKNSGQALIELMAFGAVLLFCLTLLLQYGMQANYQERLKMEAFRKAFVRARAYDPYAEYNRGLYFDPGWRYENGDDIPLPSNHWRNVNLTVIEDKPVFNAQQVLALSERNPVGAGGSAIWSLDLFAKIVEFGTEADLPRTEFEINGRRYSFTTAAFKQYPQHNNMRIKEDVPDWNGEGPRWYWRTISSVEEAFEPGELKDKKWESSDPKKYFIGASIDVDGDGYEEYILRRIGNTLLMIDYQDGQINLSEKLTPDGQEAGGLKGYDRRVQVRSSAFTRRENSSGVSTNENINSLETFTRPIYTRDGVYNVVDEFPIQKSETWYTPKE